MNRKTIVALLIFVALLCLGLSAKVLILGDGPTVTLPTAPALTGAVSQSLGPNSDGSLPVAGKDYRLSARYFDNKTWAVGSITPMNNEFDPSVVVLEKRNNAYQVVLGPGSAFSSTQLQGLPADVATYFRSGVAIYQQANGQ